MQEAREKRAQAALKRFLGALKALKRDLEVSKLVSASVLRDTEALIKKIEAEI